MDNILKFVTQYLDFITLPKHIEVIDIVEILILAFFVYEVMRWIKTTHAWILLKGIVVVLVFVALAYIFEMDIILFVVDKLLAVAITALVIVFQPELRRALEHLGQKKFMSSLLVFDSSVRKESFSNKTVDALVEASFEMGRVRTGALIVIENDIPLTEYVETGIEIDAVVSRQLIINIFEHNTPLHDGAIVLKGNRIISATCYLPLTDNMELSKELGTRHRAGIGISEVTDSLTIIVSEETGYVSIAYKGVLLRNVERAVLRKKLVRLQNRSEDTGRLKKLLKGLKKDEEAKTDE